MISETLKNPLSMFEVRGKTALITGASGAFGRGCALMLASLGCNLVLASGSKGELDAVAEELQRLAFQAAAQPHIGNLNSPTLLEKDTSIESLASGLTAMGHTVATPSVEKSGLHILERVKDGYIGGADPQ